MSTTATPRAPEPPISRWATVEDAASYVGVHPRTIRRWYGAGLIRVTRPAPQTVRVDMRSVEAYLDACASGPTAGAA